MTDKKTPTGRTPSEPPLHNFGPELTPEQARLKRIILAKMLYGGFYRCPTTGRIIEALEGDDKVICVCGRSNPRVPAERAQQTGTHIIRFLDPVTAEEYVDELDARRASKS